MTVDLSTEYLGLKLNNPLVAAASPVTGNADSLRAVEAAGAAAAVLPSLFEEQIEHDEAQVHELHQYQTDSFAESLSYFPDLQDYNTGPETYLKQVEAAKKATSIPIIGSLNGSSPGGWIQYAKRIQDAGADALELNIYFVPTDPAMDAVGVEQRYIELVAAVKDSISIPVAVKIGPNFTSLPHFAQQLIQAGASGVVLFNRYLEPDIDLEELQVEPSLLLSSHHEIRVPLRWIAILRDHLTCSIAATSGFHMADDVLKALLVGADVVMMAATLLRHGPDKIQTMRDELQAWMVEKEYESVKQLKGSMSLRNCPDPSALERGNYMKALTSFTSQSL